jgi:hypothetical protein
MILKDIIWGVNMVAVTVITPDHRRSRNTMVAVTWVKHLLVVLWLLV